MSVKNQDVARKCFNDSNGFESLSKSIDDS